MIIVNVKVLICFVVWIYMYLDKLLVYIRNDEVIGNNEEILYSILC